MDLAEFVVERHGEMLPMANQRADDSRILSLRIDRFLFCLWFLIRDEIAMYLKAVCIMKEAMGCVHGTDDDEVWSRSERE